MDFNKNNSKIECSAKTFENILLLLFMIALISLPFIMISAMTANNSFKFSIYDFIHFIYIEFPSSNDFISILVPIMISIIPIVIIEWFLRILNTKLIIDKDNITYTNHIGITYEYKITDIKTYRTIKRNTPLPKTFIWITMKNNKKIRMHSTDSNSDKLLSLLQKTNKY